MNWDEGRGQGSVKERHVPAWLRCGVVRWALLMVLTASTLTSRSLAQVPDNAPSAKPSAQAPVAFQGWDVISVKPNKTGSNSYMYGSPNDASYEAKNVGLTLLLSQAYGLREDQVSGLPGWAKTARWDINAKNPNVTGTAQAKPFRTPKQEQAADQEKVRVILQERFHLKAHTESKIGPIYDLVAAKSGPRLTEAKVKAGEGTMMWSGTKIESSATPMSQFAELLEIPAARNVLDKTGLTGAYAIKLQWSNSTQAVNSAENSGAFPDLFTALEEQLGLKLVADKGLVTTVVVDSIDLPAED